MSLLENLVVGSDVEGTDEDFIPGGNFTLDTGVYPMTITNAYLGESQGGAMNVTVWLTEVNGKRQHRETFYVTSGRAKGQKNTFVDKRTGKKRLLPGMEAMNQLATIATGSPLAAQVPEAKIVKLYNFEERKELPTEVPVLTGLVGQQVAVCITRCRENKRQNVGGEWIDSNEVREFNEVSKFLYPTGHTVAEKRAEAEAEHITKWRAQFGSDYVRDRYTPTQGSVEAASAEAAIASSAEVSSLFAANG